MNFPKIFNIKDTYLRREKVERRSYWWEKLPIIKHLATKRAMGKMHDPRITLLMDYLGLEVRVNKDGWMYIAHFQKTKKRKSINIQVRTEKKKK
jgi:hypothetical protein